MYDGRMSTRRLEELTPLVFAAAAEGDRVARAIVDRLADELAVMAIAIARRLRVASREVDVVLTGGVFRTDEPGFYARLEERLRAALPHARTRRLTERPVLGAALIGLDALGQRRGGAAEQRLRAAISSSLSRPATGSISCGMLTRNTTTGVVDPMRCPRCEQTGTRVIDSRDLDAGSTIRRRRECEACSYRFTTYERAEGARLVVVKRDGSRQDFDREKLRTGLLKALQKRPVTLDRVEAALDEIESQLRSRGDAEIPSTDIGRLATDALRELDQLAYIRFASVYHAYDDIETLQREVDRLIKQRPPV